MNWFLVLLALTLTSCSTFGKISIQMESTFKNTAIALSEIISGLNPKQLAILSVQQLNSTTMEECEDWENIHEHVGEFIAQLHRLYFKSVIFFDVELFFQYIEANLQGSIESVNLIFSQPHELSMRIQERKLSHRLSLFIFYWGAKHPPKPNEVPFKEPIRAVVITRPRYNAIYYNQAIPDGRSNLKLVNWYDSENLGLQKVPLLPNAANVYSNFNGRTFRVPVFNSPPWFWVKYQNETSNMTWIDEDSLIPSMSFLDMNPYTDYLEVNVTGGRDHRLLELLAKHMNFQFKYFEAPGRTQGSLRADGEANESFTGGIGLLQTGEADLLLGDVSLSWERHKAVEFSFFTLADSGAFATHAPRRLNEALAIIRPFKLDVWPYLILTVLLSGPIFYAVIVIPFKWDLKRNDGERDIEKLDDDDDDTTFYMVYIKEITIDTEETRRLLRLQRMDYLRDEGAGGGENSKIPPNLFHRCVWFTVQLFLKQSCQEPYNGYRAKFLMIVYCIAATYVLADVYSAQLTSQFARPAHEAPINTLERLEKAMIESGYQLFVEKESSSLEMLENGTEVFRHLYALMNQQTYEVDGHLIDSVESGLKLIADGLDNKAVLGGRETLYFNIKQLGANKFQLSQKLYTRYSAVAVQIGCPFLDSLNEVLIHLFEGGILDKMTTAEYEVQSRMIGKELKDLQQAGVEVPTETASSTDDHGSANNGNGKGAENSVEQQKLQDALVIQPLNLRMLQGAFIVLFVGYGTAGCILLLELFSNRMNFSFRSTYEQLMSHKRHLNYQQFLNTLRAGLMRVLR